MSKVDRKVRKGEARRAVQSQKKEVHNLLMLEVHKFAKQFEVFVVNYLFRIYTYIEECEHACYLESDFQLAVYGSIDSASFVNSFGKKVTPDFVAVNLVNGGGDVFDVKFLSDPEGSFYSFDKQDGIIERALEKYSGGLVVDQFKNIKTEVNDGKIITPFNFKDNSGVIPIDKFFEEYPELYVQSDAIRSLRYFKDVRRRLDKQFIDLKGL